MIDFVPLIIYMLLNPIVLIPCLFVGASGLPIGRLLLLSSVCSSIGGILSFPLIRFFVVSTPTETGNFSVLLSSVIAAVIAGAASTLVMHSLSSAGRSGRPSKPEGNNNA